MAQTYTFYVSDDDIEALVKRLKGQRKLSEAVAKGLRVVYGREQVPPGGDGSALTGAVEAVAGIALASRRMAWRDAASLLSKRPRWAHEFAKSSFESVPQLITRLATSPAENWPLKESLSGERGLEEQRKAVAEIEKFVASPEFELRKAFGDAPLLVSVSQDDFGSDDPSIEASIQNLKMDEWGSDEWEQPDEAYVRSFIAAARYVYEGALARSEEILQSATEATPKLEGK